MTPFHICHAKSYQRTYNCFVGNFTSEIVAPFIITLRLPNRGRLMVSNQRSISIKVSSQNLFEQKFWRNLIFRTQVMSWEKIHHLSLLYDLTVTQKSLLNLESFPNHFWQSIKMHKCLCKKCHRTLGKYSLRSA